MRKELLDLSGKVDGGIVKSLGIISEAADGLAIPFFVIGATARDIILSIGYDIEPERATIDLDLGVQVENWNTFARLKTTLIDTGKFTKDREPQRLRFTDGLPIDIVPFGMIADENGFISWPPDHETRMSTLGFKEAHENTIWVRLNRDPEFTIEFASLCGIATLKILSWKEKYPERAKDATDLAYIMENYVYAGNEQRIYKEEIDLLEIDGFEYEYASARLLGRDLAEILRDETKEKILEIVHQQIGNRDRYPLIEDMIERHGFFKETFEKKLKTLEHFQKGLEESR